MASWIAKDGVEFDGIFAKLPIKLHNEYQIHLSWKEEDKVFNEQHTIRVMSSDFQKETIEFYEGKRDRCCFAFGMQDIDIYRMKNGKFAITHSPHEGLNLQFIFAEYEFDKLIATLKEQFPIK